MPDHPLLPAPAGRPARRLRCPRCDRPQAACLCRWVRPTANTVAVRVLQHPLEAGHAKGSLTLLRLSLRRLQVEAGERFDSAAAAGAPASGGGARPTGPTGPTGPTDWRLLYPGDAASAVSVPPGPPPDPAACGLVVLDGTWRQTRRLLHLNPWLRHLPRWPLPAPPPSRYAIRQAQPPGRLSTLEATCLALASLEACPERYAALLAAFEGWIADQLAWRPPGPERRRC